MPNETPLIVKAAAAAALQATPMAGSSTQDDPTADHKLDYSPDNAPSAPKHQDPNSPPKASAPKDSIDEMFEDEENVEPTGAAAEEAPGAADASDDEDFLGNDEDWN